MTDEPAPEAQPENPHMRQLVDAIVAAITTASAETATDDAKARHAATAETLGGVADAFAPMVAKLTAHLSSSGEFLYATDPPNPLNPINEAISSFVLNIGMIVGFLFAIIPALGKVRVQGDINQAWAQELTMPISPADCADMLMRGVTDKVNPYAEAANSGISGDRLDALTALSGEPPGPVDMLKLWLRNDISTAELDAAIRYSRIHDTYINDVHNLAYTQMSAADAIMAALKQVVPMDEARSLFVRGGGLESDFDVLFQAAGDSIAIQQVLTLWKYGLASETEVDQALGRSRINPMFYPLAKLTHFHPLSAFQISKAITAGTITPAEGQQWLIQNGTPADQAHALATAHGTTGTAKAHAETESMITQAYDDQLLDHAQAYQALTNLGYHADVATLILQIADAKYALKQQTHAADAIRGDYLARRISRVTASGMLDALHVPAAARDHWLADWDIEIAAHPKLLTPVQLADAAAKKFMPVATAYARIVQEGYDPADAKVILLLHKVPEAEVNAV